MYNKLGDLLNTTSDMAVLRNNVAQDDGVDTVAGVDWFAFNGAVVSNLYVSGNSYVGFGSNAEHLKICRRDCKMYYLYRQEGVIGVTKFLKIRWEGYSQYNLTNNSYALAWELFMFDDGGMFLNLVAVPSVSGYLGTSTLTCGSGTYTYAVDLATPVVYSFLPQEGSKFLVTTDEYPIITKRLPYGECEFAVVMGKKVTSVKSSCISWTSVLPEGTSVKVYAALSEGEYTECEKYGHIPCVIPGDDLSNETLRVKVEMFTGDVFLTPTLTDLIVQIFDTEDDNMVVLLFDSGSTNSIQRAVGDITVVYDGSGTLKGQGGPVMAFERTFTPEGLDPKNNPHATEHIEIADMVSTGTLTRIYHTDASGNEHIELSDISAVGVLTRIEDI